MARRIGAAFLALLLGLLLAEGAARLVLLALEPRESDAQNLAAREVDEPLYTDDCCHFGARGNEIMADALARLLTR